MKKFLFLLILLLGIPVMIFAQGTEGIDWAHLKEYFASISTLAVLVVALTTIILKWIPNASKLVKQLISLGIGLALGLLGWVLQWGLFEGLTWWVSLLYGLAAGFGGNGVFDLIKGVMVSVKKPTS